MLLINLSLLGLKMIVITMIGYLLSIFYTYDVVFEFLLV